MEKNFLSIFVGILINALLDRGLGSKKFTFEFENIVLPSHRLIIIHHPGGEKKNKKNTRTLKTYFQCRIMRRASSNFAFFFFLCLLNFFHSLFLLEFDQKRSFIGFLKPYFNFEGMVLGCIGHRRFTKCT